MTKTTAIATLKHLLNKCSQEEPLIKQIHAQSITNGLFTQQDLACKLLNTYAKKLNKPHVARLIFFQIPSPDIVTYTSLLNVHLQTQQPTSALALFTQLTCLQSVRLDSHSLVAAASACARSQNLRYGNAVHGMVYRLLGYSLIPVGNTLIDMYCKNNETHSAKTVFDQMEDKDVATWTSLLSGYVACGDFEGARKVFSQMPHKNVISWTAMIVGYMREKNSVGGLELFRRMRTESEDRPTAITIVAVLSGCADAGALDFGKLVHGYVNKVEGLVDDVAVNNGLIDMYSKSGNVDAASKIFKGMLDKDVFSWTSIVSGLALHGRGRSALNVFNDMVESGVVPNDITFVSVLSACTHGGLVSEGKALFNMMSNHYNLIPKIEHYGCMMDLLGRAGKLEEMIDLIEGMPIKPDVVIWKSLLFACLTHGKLELAEMAGNKVIELEPGDDGGYMSLYNIYGSNKRWEDATRIVKLMRDQGIKKKPGCSWIDVNGIVSEFFAEDFGHNSTNELLTVLEGIASQSKIDMNIGTLAEVDLM